MNHLSSNIRFLRKQRKLSQQQLADDLGVKRSNIAAYETKNVEPRLSLITSLANYFEVTVEEFILVDLQSLNAGHNGNGSLQGLQRRKLSVDAVEEIERIAHKVERMLEGFKIFYEFKLKMNEETEAEGSDIDNFLVFIDHMAEYNRMIDETVRTGRIAHQSSDHNGATLSPNGESKSPNLIAAAS